MTRKHFEAIAKIIKNTPHMNDEQRDRLAFQFAALFANFNPNFDMERFCAACHNPKKD